MSDDAIDRLIFTCCEVPYFSTEEGLARLDAARAQHASNRACRATCTEAPAVTVEELAGVIAEQRNHGTQWRNDDIARAVLELMQRRAVPAAECPICTIQDGQWSDFAPACRCGKCTACAAREVKP